MMYSFTKVTNVTDWFVKDAMPTLSGFLQRQEQIIKSVGTCILNSPKGLCKDFIKF